MSIQDAFPLASDAVEDFVPRQLGREDGDFVVTREKVYALVGECEKGDEVGEVTIQYLKSKDGQYQLTVDFHLHDGRQERFSGEVPRDTNGKLGPGKVKNGVGLIVNVDECNPKRWIIEGGG